MNYLHENSESGLTANQVKERIKKGLVNENCTVKTKSVGQIIFSNVFTPFNGVNIALAFMVAMVHSYKNMLFLMVVLWNTLIGIVQEIRSKRIVDKLSLLSAPHAEVIRDGERKQINVEDIVLDDVLYLKNGDQVCADARIIKGQCQVNESLLTGESDPVFKKTSDNILSGSFIVGGSVIAVVEHVGAENYVNKIADQAKYVKKPNSEILSSINTIIKIVSIVLIPIAALLFMQQIHMKQTLQTAVVATVAAVIGMIPSGLVLLISVVLAVSVIRLGNRQSLVQEMFCIETLARVDTLCLDKTGTITEGTMCVQDVKILDKNHEKEFDRLLFEYTKVLEDNNPTFFAVTDYLKEKFKNLGKTGEEEYRVTSKEDFSSDTKRSSVTFKNEGTYVLGAMEFMNLNNKEEVEKIVHKYSEKGLRVLTFAKKCDDGFFDCVGIIIISDKIRKNAKKTLSYFRSQGVDIKVISGDNPLTVKYIAKKAGLRNANKVIDASTLKTEEEVKKAALTYSVFGRVTPAQKLMIVKELKEKGHIVAMTGDGVNDVMALKESDCSIAMESGSDAARNVSQIVLMDSDFGHMPEIVAEGRKTINNIQRSAALYLNKTIYSTILAVLFVILPWNYPFMPIQLTLIGALTIGIPSFILAMEPNINRVKGHFLENVLRMAIPGGILVVTNVIAAEIFGYITAATSCQRTTMVVYGLAIAALFQLIRLCKPFNTLRRVMVCCLSGIFVTAAIFLKDFFGLCPIRYYQWFMIGIMAVCSFILLYVYSVLTEVLMGKIPNKYNISVTYCDGLKVILVNDNVEPKDYYDVTAQMKGLKILNADKVIFVKDADEGSNLRIESCEPVDDREVMCAVKAYCKKNRTKEQKYNVNVLVKEALYGAEEYNEQPLKRQTVFFDSVENSLEFKSYDGMVEDGQNKEELCADKKYKARVIKNITLTF